MGTFDMTNLTACNAAVFGAAATYTDRDGTDTALTSVLLEEMDVREEQSEDGINRARTAKAWILQSELATRPDRGQLTHGGLVWSVEGVGMDEPGNVWSVQLYLRDPIERSREGLRRLV